jgi:hypothetical protein
MPAGGAPTKSGEIFKCRTSLSHVGGGLTAPSRIAGIELWLWGASPIPCKHLAVIC